MVLFFGELNLSRSGDFLDVYELDFVELVDLDVELSLDEEELDLDVELSFFNWGVELSFLIWDVELVFLSWKLEFSFFNSDLEKLERDDAFVELVDLISLVWFLLDKFDFKILVWFFEDWFGLRSLVWFLVDKFALFFLILTGTCSSSSSDWSNPLLPTNCLLLCP